MFKASIMYPNEEGVKFDIDYYRTTHMALAQKHLKPFGLIRFEVDKGLSGGGDQPAPYVCIGHLYFETQDGYDKGMAEAAPVLRGDIPNFTNVTPVRQISKILD